VTGPSRDRRAAWGTVGLILLVTWGLTTHGKYSVTGDEPHYLMVAQSLASDGDLDVGNNYARNDGARFGASDAKPELHIRRSATGRVLPVHDIGVPVLLLPVYIAATNLATVPSEGILRRFRMNRGLFAYSLISLAVLALSTAAAFVTMRALQSSGAPPRIAASVVAIAWLCPPVLSNAFLVFPEPFALFVTACVVASWTAPSDCPWRRGDYGVVLMLGMLPWLHRKFAFYAVALLCVLVWRRRAALRPLTRRQTMLAAVLFAALPLALALWTLHEWGNLAGPLALERLPFSSSAFAHGAAGTIVDRENGLIWWAPIYALIPAAFWMRRSDLWPWLLPILALTVPSAAHDQWWGGFSPAGRFLVPLAPVFCLFGVELTKTAPLRVVSIALLVPQTIVTAYAWQHTRLLWPQGDGENRVLAILLPPLGRLYRAIPSFRTAPGDAWFSAAVLLAGILALNVLVVLASSRRSRS
jgi:hypothetical protein